MAQEKSQSKADDEQRRDEDGRFTEKDDSSKSSGTSGNGMKAKAGDSKSSGSESKGKSGGSSRSGSSGQSAKSR